MRPTRVAHALRTLAAGVAIAFLACGALLLALTLGAEPAAADNCKELVKGFNDLLDENNVQDCLRTGGPWGAVLGTVVAATAAGVGAAGLSGRRNPPDEGPPPADDPCDDALNMKDHTLALIAKREAKQQQITEEWRRIAADAARFAQMYRSLKEQEYKLGLCRVYATVGNAAGVGAVVVGIVASVAELGTIATARLASLDTASMGTGRVVLEKAWIHFATKVKQAGAIAIPWHAPIRSFDPADFTGGDYVKPLWEKMGAVAGAYQAAAHQFNDATRTWANDAQQELAEIDQDIRDARSRLRTAHSLCSGEALDETEDPIEPSGTILVPQAQTQFGSVWWFGGTWGYL
jgi:hypothetical protein